MSCVYRNAKKQQKRKLRCRRRSLLLGFQPRLASPRLASLSREPTEPRGTKCHVENKRRKRRPLRITSTVAVGWLEPLSVLYCKAEQRRSGVSAMGVAHLFCSFSEPSIGPDRYSNEINQSGADSKKDSQFEIDNCIMVMSDFSYCQAMVIPQLDAESDRDETNANAVWRGGGHGGSFWFMGSDAS